MMPSRFCFFFLSLFFFSPQFSHLLPFHTHSSNRLHWFPRAKLCSATQFVSSNLAAVSFKCTASTCVCRAHFIVGLSFSFIVAFIVSFVVSSCPHLAFTVRDSVQHDSLRRCWRTSKFSACTKLAAWQRFLQRCCWCRGVCLFTG